MNDIEKADLTYDPPKSTASYEAFVLVNLTSS
jgi:hypothetical protein